MAIRGGARHSPLVWRTLQPPQIARYRNRDRAEGIRGSILARSESMCVSLTSYGNIRYYNTRPNTALDIVPLDRSGLTPSKFELLIQKACSYYYS
jgi:hypothetical protein